MLPTTFPINSPSGDPNTALEYALANFPSDVQAEIDRIRRVRMFARRELIFQEGDRVDEIFIVSHGSVALYFTSSRGDTVLLGLALPGEILGLSSALSMRPHLVTAQALELSRVLAITKDQFISLVDRFPSFALYAAAELSRKINRAYDKIRLTGAGFSVQQRLAAWILQMHESDPVSKRIVIRSLTHERIAQLLNLSRESVTRALSGLKRAGAIEQTGDEIEILNLGYLHTLVNQHQVSSVLREAV
jgi:CRP-like cAMP-binding protein